MHKSKLGILVIDCQTNDLTEATEFWSKALGRTVEGNVDPGTENYRQLKTRTGEAEILLQAVDHPSRVHLDISTNDKEAEVKRLEKLGAKVIGPCKKWVVMEAPTGQRFCVVGPHGEDFEETANEWD